MDANGVKRKCAVLNGVDEGDKIELVTVEPAETLTLGGPTRDQEGAKIGEEHWNGIGDILGNVADSLLNSSISNGARTLFGQYDKSIKSVQYTGWQDNARNYIKFDWDRLNALKLTRYY